VHGRGTHIVTAADRGRGALDPGDAVPQADALVTRDPGTVLAVLAADCVPAVLYDPGAHVLACVHAGWRGTVARVLHAAVDAMATLGTRPQDIVAALGPAVAPDHYQVGEDVKAAADGAFGDGARSVVRPDGNGRWLFDLWEANRLVLREAGVPDGQVHVAGIATGPAPGLFFSHRAEQPCGRFAAVARLAPGGGA
jgi:polyphenol oxidase